VSEKKQPPRGSQPYQPLTSLRDDPSFEAHLSQARAIAYQLILHTGIDPALWESLSFAQLVDAESIRSLFKEPAEIEAALFEVKAWADVGYRAGFALGRMAGRLLPR
jgi:hypothetical protein